MEKTNSKSATLLIYCEDRSGIIAAVTDFIQAHDGNIIYLDQYVDFEENIFFMRVEWDLQNFVISPDKIETLFKEGLAKKFKMNYRLSFSDEKLRMAIFVSKLPHCLYDIISRCQSGEWTLDVPVIISNHQELEPVAKSFGIDYQYLPITADNKKEQEAKQIELMKKYNIDFIVLARYMQILSGELYKELPIEGNLIFITHFYLHSRVQSLIIQLTNGE